MTCHGPGDEHDVARVLRLPSGCAARHAPARMLPFVGLLVLGAAAAEPMSVMILPLEAKEGVSRDAADQLAAAMAAHASTLPGLKVVTYKEVESTLSQEQVRQVAGCSSAGCAAEIAGALNTQAIIIGSFGRFGRNYLLNLSLVRARDANVSGRCSRKFPGDAMEAVLDAIPAILADLFPQQLAAAQPATPSSPTKAATRTWGDDVEAKWDRPARKLKRRAEVDDEERDTSGDTKTAVMDPALVNMAYRTALGMSGLAATLLAVSVPMCGYGCFGTVAWGGVAATGTSSGGSTNTPLVLGGLGSAVLAGLLAWIPLIGGVAVGAVSAGFWILWRVAGAPDAADPPS